MRDVIVDANATREAVCPDGHYFRVAGILHWNPWGTPDFEATGPRRCECGLQGRLLSKDEQAARDMERYVREHGPIPVRHTW